MSFICMTDAWQHTIIVYLYFYDVATLAIKIISISCDQLAKNLAKIAGV